MKLEILGSGCAKCEALAGNVKAAVKALGISADISKVTDILEIADRGALFTPALAVDGEIVIAGKSSSSEEIQKALKGRL